MGSVNGGNPYAPLKLQKHFLEEQNSDGEGIDEDHNSNSNNAANLGFSKGILEIINDDDEDKIRTSSNDIQINEEVFMFLRRMDLEFLVECFTG